MPRHPDELAVVVTLRDHGEFRTSDYLRKGELSKVKASKLI
jgi:hypothetical protein